jgi:type III pantothenate kinase
MKETAIVVDVGNTSTSVGLWAGGRIVRTGRRDTAGATVSSLRAFLARWLAGRPVAGAALASVVPAATAAWRAALTRAAGSPPVEVRHDLDLGVRVTYPRPATIGADRLANAAEAHARHGAPCIVADFGTALTFDVITRRGGYIGGVICPGLPLMFSYFAEKTALLPRIGPGPVRRSVGTSTVEAMRLGAQWGYRGMVREIAARLLERPDLRGATLVATGGYAPWVVRGLEGGWIVDRELTLAGIGRILDLNRPRGR